MEVWEYSTTSAYDAMDRITEWVSWNTELHPEKLVFEKNVPPLPEMGGMNGNLFDEDRVPQYVLFDDGHYEKIPVAEEIKVKTVSVMQYRFDQKYTTDRKIEISMILAMESTSTAPLVLEYKADVDTLNALKALG